MNFKIGDKVIVREATYHSFPDGMRGAVEDTDPTHCIVLGTDSEGEKYVQDIRHADLILDNAKYTIQPIDYTGCHPVIAEHLKRGEAILCRVWGAKNKKKKPT